MYPAHDHNNESDSILAPGPPVFPSPLLGALRQLAQASHLLVATDVDGTIAPIVAQPADARVLPEAETALERLLRLPGTWVALVSGRSLQSLREMGAPQTGMILSGSHGAELEEEHLSPDGSSPTGQDIVPRDAPLEEPLTAQERALYSQVLSTFAHAIEGSPEQQGAWLERKPVGVALHTRALSEGESAGVIYSAEQAVHALPVTKLHGKRIFEVSVREHDKGSALQRIRAAVAADLVLFLGDDETDEYGFRVLGANDVGVRVGPGETAAEFRISDPAEGALLLARLAALREAKATGVPVSRQ